VLIIRWDNVDYIILLLLMLYVVDHFRLWTLCDFNFINLSIRAQVLPVKEIKFLVLTNQSCLFIQRIFINLKNHACAYNWIELTLIPDWLLLLICPKTYHLIGNLVWHWKYILYFSFNVIAGTFWLMLIMHLWFCSCGIFYKLWLSICQLLYWFSKEIISKIFGELELHIFCFQFSPLLFEPLLISFNFEFLSI
jgi:hypothetical protein